MKSLLLVGLLCLTVATAWPSVFDTQQQQQVSNDEFLRYQSKILNLLTRIHDPATDPEIQRASKFNPGDNTQAFNNPEKVKMMVDKFNNGQLRERGKYFSLFEPEHRRQAMCLYECFIGAKSLETWFKLASWARENFNEGIFTYALIASAANRPELRGIRFPPPYEINPHFFVPTEVIQEAYRAQMKQTPKIIQTKFTGTPKNYEQRVAYFGEDLGLESHHFFWHIDFPFWWKKSYNKKDRKGELFFHMHHQLNARFDAERLSNNLPMVEPIGWTKEIKQGFAPHATYLKEGEFPARPDNMKFQDLPFLTLRDMSRYESRIREAIDRLEVLNSDGTYVNLNNTEGIEILGNLIESNDHSPNPTYYGSIHNMVHILLSRITDPDGKYGLPPGVMEHFETSTRDPTFFRLHKYLDNIFKDYKSNLAPYTKEEVEFQGVTVEAVKVSTQGPSTQTNELLTFFSDFELDLNNALDHIEGREVVDIRSQVRRLDNEAFTYRIQVSSDRARLATVRIFLAPKYTWYGAEVDFDTKRWEMIEMDKFVTKLSAGSNTVLRESRDSSVTIPDYPSFQQLRKETEEALNGLRSFDVDKDIRHCGIPDRLLLPKGNRAGMDFELWVVVSDYEQDKVHDLPHDYEFGGSLSYCGFLHDKYPDRRAMGYPWDRKINNVKEFITSNIKKVDIKIRHVEY